MAETPKSHSEELPEDQKSKGAKKAGKAARAALTAAVEDPKLNLIQFTINTSAPQGGGAKEPEREKKEGDTPDRRAEPEKPPESRISRIPDAVHERFINIGDNFYFPDGSEAFQYQGNRLTTRSENAVVIQAMVAIAQVESKDGAVTVKGSDFFRKEAWFAASLAGLKVNGYEPTEFERERLVRAVARRAAPATRDENDDKTRAAPGGDGVKNERKAAARTAESELVTGRLVDHGVAHYKHNPKEDLSYFVRIETAEGDRDIWGVDLERAFRHSLSTPGIGDAVGVRAIGKDAVTVLAAERDADGNEINRKPLNTHRNQWIVERQEFLDRRAQLAEVFRDPAISAEEGIRRHPELEGTYQTLQIGHLAAEEQYGGSKGHREQWLEHLRTDLARRIEYGQPLEPARLRAREAPTREPRVPDRDHSPTR